MRFGVHMAQKGGFAANLRRLKEMGFRSDLSRQSNCLEDGRCPSRSWRGGGLAEELEIRPLVIHCPDLINLASPNPDFHDRSRELLRQTMERAALYGSPYVVLHTGNHGGAGIEAGLELLVETIAGELPRWPAGVKLLLENTAGSGTALGSRFEELARVLKAFPPGALGVCFDTAHAWGAGYDLGSARGVEQTLEQFEKHIGLEHLCLLHLNDAKAGLGSRVDRHEHIGCGGIGREGFRALLNQDWPEDMPAILETPEMGGPWDRRNLEMLVELGGVG